MPFRRIILRLLLAALALPIALVIDLAVARLLAALGDAAGALWLDRLALVGGMLWFLVLVSLVIVLALKNLRGPNPPSD